VSQFYGKPLNVKVERGRLLIEIGVDVLAHAVGYSDWANPYDETRHDYVRTFAITDADAFAADVKLAMLKEEEDGSSLLTNFIDLAMQSAIDDGSIACEYEQVIPHGQTAARETWAERREKP